VSVGAGDHDRPPGVDDATVAAVGRVTEALEWVERARGHLYEFHQLMGHADQAFAGAAGALAEAGAPALASLLRHEVVGRNALEDRWTFQIVEEFDDGYYAAFVGGEERLRNELLEVRRHVFESEMKEQERTRGRDSHECNPEVRRA